MGVLLETKMFYGLPPPIMLQDGNDSSNAEVIITIIEIRLSVNFLQPLDRCLVSHKEKGKKVGDKKKLSLHALRKTIEHAYASESA